MLKSRIRILNGYVQVKKNVEGVYPIERFVKINIFFTADFRVDTTKELGSGVGTGAGTEDLAALAALTCSRDWRTISSRS